MVTLEAYHNYKRIAQIHPTEFCHDDEGEFGPAPVGAKT